MTCSQEDERRKAQKDEFPEDELPLLWILAATTSKPLLKDGNVALKPGWRSDNGIFDKL